MTMVSGNWTEPLEDILRTIYEKQMGKQKDYLPVIYNVEKSTRAVENNLGVGSLGTMDEWTGSVPYEDVNKGFLSTYRHKKYAKGLQIERDLVEDDQYGVIRKRTNALATSVWYTRQIHAASLFNGAFGISSKGPDGLPLCSASHTLSPSNSTTWSNYDTLSLTADNLETVRNRMKLWTDDKGNLLAINPDTLVVAPSKRKTARMIADTPEEPATSDHGVNVWKGALDVIEWDFLTSNPNAWFLMDMTRAKALLNWYDRRIPILESDGNDFDTEVGKWKTVGRWSFGYDDPSFIYGCNAAS